MKAVHLAGRRNRTCQCNVNVGVGEGILKLILSLHFGLVLDNQVKMSLRWLRGQESNSESLRTEHSHPEEAIGLGQSGVRRQAPDQTEDVAPSHAKEGNLWTHVHGCNKLVGNTVVSLTSLCPLLTSRAVIYSSLFSPAVY